MAIDPGTSFSDNNQNGDMTTIATLGVRMAAFAKLVEGLESELLKIKDKVYCLEEKVAFLEKENKQIANMEQVIKSFFYDTDSFNEFMFKNVKNYDYLLTGLKDTSQLKILLFLVAIKTS